MAAGLCAGCGAAGGILGPSEVTGVPESAPVEVQAALRVLPHKRSDHDRSVVDGWCLDESGDEMFAGVEGATVAPEVQDVLLQAALARCSGSYLLDASERVTGKTAKEVYEYRVTVQECLTTLGVETTPAPSEDEFVSVYEYRAKALDGDAPWDPLAGVGPQVPSDVLVQAHEQCFSVAQ